MLWGCYAGFADILKTMITSMVNNSNEEMEEMFHIATWGILLHRHKHKFGSINSIDPVSYRRKIVVRNSASIWDSTYEESL